MVEKWVKMKVVCVIVLVFPQTKNNDQKRTKNEQEQKKEQKKEQKNKRKKRKRWVCVVGLIEWWDVLKKKKEILLFFLFFFCFVFVCECFCYCLWVCFLCLGVCVGVCVCVERKKKVLFFLSRGNSSHLLRFPDFQFFGAERIGNLAIPLRKHFSRSVNFCSSLGTAKWCFMRGILDVYVQWRENVGRRWAVLSAFSCTFSCNFL